MEHKFETSKTFDGPAGNSYAELTAAREHERQDAIKKGLIDDPDKPKALEDAQVFRGTCMDMCPLYEREQREFQNDVKRWEMNQTTGRIDKDLAVKAFHRPAAGNEQALPSDVRPPPVLTQTLTYLVDRIVSASDPLDKDTHGFVRDRTRSIRQDFTLQNERGSEAIACHERIVRFHILSLHQMCEIDGFDAHQEMEQLRKTLQSLAEYYDDQRENGNEYPNEAEFRAYHILTRLRDPDVLRYVQTLPRLVRMHNSMRHALNLYKYAQRSNEEIGRFKSPNCEGSYNAYSTFFRLISSSKTTYTMACLCETQFNDIRKGALKAIRKAFISAVKAPSVDELVELLGCDDSAEVESQCEQYSVIVRADEAGIMRPLLNKTTAFDETRPDLRQRFSERLVEGKRGDLSFADVINGAVSTNSPKTTVVSPGRRRRVSSMQPVVDQSIFSSIPPLSAAQNNDKSSLIGINQNKSVGPFQFATTRPLSNIDEVAPALEPKKATQQAPSQVSALSSSTPVSSIRIDNSAIIQQASTDVVERLLREQTQSTLAMVYARQAQSRKETTALVANLSSDLVDDLIRNQLHDTIIDSYAKHWHDKHERRRAWHKFCRVSNEVQFKRRMKREREEVEEQKKREYSAAFHNLHSDLRRGQFRKRARSNLNQSSESANVKNMVQAQDIAKRFWQPLELRALFNSIPSSEHQSRWQLVISSSDSSSDKWIEQKFCISNGVRVEQFGNTEMSVSLVDGQTSKSLSNTKALIFQSTGEDNFDRSSFLSLVQKIAEESDYCFPVLVLSFSQIEDEEALARALMMPEVMADKKSPVTACHFCAIQTMNDIAAFETSLTQMLATTSTKTSPLGLERAAAKQREERRDVTPIRIPIRAHPIRQKTSFYDSSVLQPVTPNRAPFAPVKEIMPQQITNLRESVQRAKALLSRTLA